VVKELTARGVRVFATCRKTNAALDEAAPHKIIEGVDVVEDDSVQSLVQELKGETVDLLFVIAGYFTTETFENLNWKENRKMYEICANGPLRVTQALVLGGLMPSGSKVALITSEGGRCY
jgi:NADP-dependent 3-hydroxy acid dehydrogenase YdfG